MPTRKLIRKGVRRKTPRPKFLGNPFPGHVSRIRFRVLPPVKFERHYRSGAGQQLSLHPDFSIRRRRQAGVKAYDSAVRTTDDLREEHAFEHVREMVHAREHKFTPNMNSVLAVLKEDAFVSETDYFRQRKKIQFSCFKPEKSGGRNQSQSQED